MAEIGSWNGHRFVVKPNLIESFSDLSIKGSTEVEEKTGNGEKYVDRKDGKPFEVGLTVELNAYLGCNVRQETMKLVEEAQRGESSYFYIAGKKLLPCKLMLVEASAADISMNPRGVWISCNVQLKMKQASKGDNTSETSSGGGGGKSNWWDRLANAGKKALSETTATNALSNLFNNNGSLSGTENGAGSAFSARYAEVQAAQQAGRNNTETDNEKVPEKAD